MKWKIKICVKQDIVAIISIQNQIWSSVRSNANNPWTSEALWAKLDVCCEIWWVSLLKKSGRLRTLSDLLKGGLAAVVPSAIPSSIPCTPATFWPGSGTGKSCWRGTTLTSPGSTSGTSSATTKTGGVGLFTIMSELSVSSGSSITSSGLKSAPSSISSGNVGGVSGGGATAGGSLLRQIRGEGIGRVAGTGRDLKTRNEGMSSSDLELVSSSTTSSAWAGSSSSSTFSSTSPGTLAGTLLMGSKRLRCNTLVLRLPFSLFSCWTSRTGIPWLGWARTT